MNNLKGIIHLVFATCILIHTTLLQAAAQPTFGLTPTTATSIQVPSNSTAIVQYRVVNNTRITRTLTMVPIIGVNQIINTGNCPSPFTLAPQQSCLLSLQVNGSQLSAEGIHQGPIVCKTKGNGDNDPDAFLCSQPNSPSTLNITPFPSADIFLSRSPLFLKVGATSGFFVITNLSDTLTVTNVVADFTGTPLNGNVIQNADNCALVAPGQSCTIIFTSGTQAVAATNFPIKGDNTNTLTGVIGVNNVHAFIVNQGSSTVTQCTVTLNTGVLTGCSDVGAGAAITNPEGITLNSVGSIAYVTNLAANGSVTKCNVDGATGAFSGCADSGAGAIFSNPIGIILNGSETFAYVVQNGSVPPFSGSVTQCNVNPNTGVLSGCIDSGAAGLNFPANIAFNSTGTKVYISDDALDGGTSSITQCNANPNTGVFSGCTNFDFISPIRGFGISLNSTNTIAYVTTGPSTTAVLQCSINVSTGLITSCVDSGVGSVPFNNPFNITLNPANTFAYVANVGPNLQPGSVSQCSINAGTGAFSGCVDSGATVLNHPFGIVLR